MTAGGTRSDEVIAATDTTYGHYQQIDTGYDIRLPNSLGSEAFAGSIHTEVDQFELSRSWKKQDIEIKLDIAYTRKR